MSTETNRPVAVLIVAYRSAEKLNKCLALVQQHLPKLDIHVWDNSGDLCDEVRQLSKRYTSVNWHLGSTNIGFAAAINRLAATVPEHDLLLLNPDAELLTSLELTRMEIQQERVAASGPLDYVDTGVNRRPTLFARSQMPWDSAHRRFSLLNIFGGATGLGNRLRGTPYSNLYWRQPSEVSGYLTGACLAINRDAWNQVGEFNEEFFLYGEEADWQQRAIAAGWRLRLANEVGIRHVEMGTVEPESPGRKRSEDLLQAALALIVEHKYGRFVSELYVAARCAASDIRRLGRNCRRPLRPDVLLTIDDLANDQHRCIRTAVELDEAGYSVVVVCLQRFGELAQTLPTSIRLVRRSWWWPSVALFETPLVVVVGNTSRERRFARLLALRRQSESVTVAVGSGELHRVLGRGR